jgi:predicted NBD/HSP70 family sugar kinase
MVGTRQRLLLQTLWNEGPLSRWELHEKTGIRPNTVGADTGLLLDEGILCEGEPTSTPRSKRRLDIPRNGRGRGRPRVPLRVDTERREFLGLALRPGAVSLAMLNLKGELTGDVEEREIKDAGRLIRTAKDMLDEKLSDRVLCVGLSTPGFVDPDLHNILLSSAWPGQGTVSLSPLYETDDEMPFVLENDMHALAARWLLTHKVEQNEDVLLVYFDDGQLGSALLINGRPNRGCVTAGNELGHTRLAIETDRCYCGHLGCIERICSSEFLARSANSNGSASNNGSNDFASRAKDFSSSDADLSKLIELVSMGISNAVNFSRVNRVVLVSGLTQHEAFAGALVDSVRGQMLAELSTRVQIDLWNQPATESAETAGWLAMASLYLEGWLQPINEPV